MSYIKHMQLGDIYIGDGLVISMRPNHIKTSKELDHNGDKIPKDTIVFTNKNIDLSVNGILKSIGEEYIEILVTDAKDLDGKNIYNGDIFKLEYNSISRMERI